MLSFYCPKDNKSRRIFGHQNFKLILYTSKVKCLGCKGHKGVFGKSPSGHPATLPCGTCDATGEIGENMKLIHVIIDAEPKLTTFSPIEVIELIMAEAKRRGREVLVDIYMTEVK